MFLVREFKKSELFPSFVSPVSQITNWCQEALQSVQHTIQSQLNVYLTTTKKQITHCLICGFSYTQVCDSDTMLDPASSVEMVKVLEEDPMVGGVGGDVQVG